MSKIKSSFYANTYICMYIDIYLTKKNKITARVNREIKQTLFEHNDKSVNNIENIQKEKVVLI
jgi:retron-type reverse transcriptase